MNNANINLLIKDTTPKPSDAKGLKIFRLAAYGSFGVTLIASIVLLLMVFFHPLPKKQEEKNLLIQQISNSSEKYINLLSLNDRIKNIDSVITKRPQYERLMELLKNQLPEGGTVETLKMTGNEVSIAISSDSLENMETFISNLKRVNNESTRVFRTISLTNLTYNSQLGKFVLTLDMTTV